MSNNYLYNTRNRANAALRRPSDQREVSGDTELVPVVVTAVNEDNSYDVRSVDGSLHVQRIMAHPSDTEMEVGADAWLWLPGNLILSAGGGGGDSTCAIQLNAFGCHFG